MTFLRRLVWPCLVGVLWVAVASRASAQQFVERTYHDERGAHKYAVFVPAGYQPGRSLPAVLFLHGAGERGTDGIKPTLVGMGPYLKARGRSVNFLAIFPQVEDTEGRLLTAWQVDRPDGERALQILDQVQKSYNVDPRKIALVGWSMGGYGAWNLAAAHPEKWSAVAVLSGGKVKDVAKIQSRPVWVFHGARDHLVSVTDARNMVETLNGAGGDVVYHEFPAAGHEIFAETFGNDAFLAWLVDPQQPRELKPMARAVVAEPPPFIPALHIPGAVGIRLGNEALEALSYAAPQLVSGGRLSGGLGDMFDSTSVQGRSFSVRFSGISYSAQVGRVQLKAVGANRLNLQIELQSAAIQIGGTSISGERHSAQAGPISINIGQRGPVTLSLDVAPAIDNQRIRLRLIGAGFSIPPDNYSVSSPAGVSVRGIGMTQDRVVSGLVSGLYGARGRIENEVRNIAPTILQQLEGQFALPDIGSIIAGLWPLPVYQPRLRAVPEQILADEHGISMVLGVDAAAFDLLARPKTVTRSAAAGVTLAHLSGDALGVTFAPQLLGPLTQAFVEAGLAHLDVLDIPEPSFARLSDRGFLQAIIPDLNRFDEQTQLRTELLLAGPLSVNRLNGNSDPNGDDAIPLEFRLPKVVLRVSTKSPGGARWEPYVNLDLAIQELVAADLKKPTHERRVLEMQWKEDRQITGMAAFATGATPQNDAIDSDRFIAAFRECWEKWTASGPAVTATVPDVQFSTIRLRLEALGGPAPVLSARFDVPIIRLANLTDENFVYETKGPNSGWSPVYTLPPGKSHEYRVLHPLLYRHVGGGVNETYSLYQGSHSEYRIPKTGGRPRLFQAREPAAN